MTAPNSWAETRAVETAAAKTRRAPPAVAEIDRMRDAVFPNPGTETKAWRVRSPAVFGIRGRAARRMSNHELVVHSILVRHQALCCQIKQEN
jgi:hypothetical protein